MISFYLPYLPPTTNHAYITKVKKVGGKGRVTSYRTLSEEGKSFKRGATTAMLRHLVHTKMVTHKRYGLALLFAFPELENKGWPDRAQTRFKKRDASNRVKLLEDCIAAVCGVDDRQFFPIIIDKVEGDDRTYIWIWSVDDDPRGAESALRAISAVQQNGALPEMHALG